MVGSEISEIREMIMRMRNDDLLPFLCKMAVQSKEGASAGIPEAVFVDDVDKYMTEPGNTSAEVVLKKFDDLYKKYKFMEVNLMAKRNRLRVQIPEMTKTLNMAKFLKSKQGSDEVLSSHFMLSDSVYAQAEIPPTDTVLLWLGANVMLEYPIDEALELLEKNSRSANSSLESAQKDLDKCKDQITTLEVNMARVYNWDVQQRKKEKTSS